VFFSIDILPFSLLKLKAIAPAALLRSNSREALCLYLSSSNNSSSKWQPASTISSPNQLAFLSRHKIHLALPLPLRGVLAFLQLMLSSSGWWILYK
jgi:hypothetical protein